ncbi:MAG: YicC family protein [Synergistaceae bacterium]|nr:YicC family protein [Synergistaceae bacterium]
MFLSMTGFGRASREFPWGTVTFEAVSVNHRYQDISVRLPKEIHSLESALTASLRSLLRRGKIRLIAEIDWAADFKTARIDTCALRSYYDRIQEVAAEVNAPQTELTALLNLPGVCDSMRLREGISGELGEPAEFAKSGGLWKDLVCDTVDALMEMKRSEGEKLQAVVEEDLKELERLTGALSERWNSASSEALSALGSRIEKVMERFALEIDRNRIAQEISLLADKWDVSEELARLAGHIAKFREIASGRESEGRKLDFLIQEMNREVNTMGSKTGDAEFRWMVVEAKSCLERIREQIQNVE